MYKLVLLAFGAFSLGIAFRSHYDFGWSFVVLLVLISSCAVLVFRQRTIVAVLVGVLFFTIGIARMEFAIPMDVHEETPAVEISFTGRVVREPDIRGTHTNLVVMRDDVPQKLLVRVSPFENVSYADEVSITGVLEPSENFEGEGGRIFNYRAYLAKDSIHYIVPFPEISVYEHNKTPTGFLLELKTTYLTALKRVLPEPSAALAGGITVGERRSLGEKLTQDFRDTGLIHIVVLSGYNIAVVVIFIVALLSFLPKRPRHIVAIGGIIVFTILVGASATVVRAAIMGSIGALGIVVGRTYDALYTLVLAGFGMLLWNPYLLMYDPSFQLSFVATLGLLLGVPILLPYVTFIPNKWALREIAAATIATQIAVLPLLVYMIGDVSLVAVFVNLLVLPVIPLAMLFVFLAGVVGMIYAPVAIIFAGIAHALLTYVIIVVETFAQIPLAVVSVPTFPFSLILLTYGLLSIGVWYAKSMYVTTGR